MNIPQLDSTYIANTYARFPVTIARGKGSLVWDADDKVYIDMATGIAVNSFGIADPAWIRAVTEQLCTVQHASNLYYTAPDAQLAQLLRSLLHGQNAALQKVASPRHSGRRCVQPLHAQMLHFLVQKLGCGTEPAPAP